MSATEESIAEALQASWNEAVGESETPTTEAEPEVSEPEPEAEAVEAEATAEEVSEEPQEETETPEVFQAPEHWTAEQKAQFSVLPPEAQQVLLDRDGEFQRGYQEQVEGVSDIMKALEPWKQIIAQRGVSEADAIRTLFAAQAQIEQNPIEGILKLAQMYGVSDQLQKQFSPDPDDDFADPEIKALRKQIQDLTGKLTNVQQAQETSYVQAGQKTIDDFKGQTDADGNLVHPYFDDVQSLILPLVQDGKTLEQAYNEAVWSVPAYRETHLKAQQAEQASKDELEKARKVKEAKKAAKTVKQSGKDDVSDVEKKPKSLADQLQAAWNEHS